MKKVIGLLISMIALGGWFTGCLSAGTGEKPARKGEAQLEKFGRLVTADAEKLVIGSDNMATVESIEAAFQPQVITGIAEITRARLSEPGRPYYFKIRAIYKGYDTRAKKALLQDRGERQPSTMDAALGAAFGVDTSAYSVDLLSDAIIATLPADANSTATFYIIAAQFTEDEGKPINETLIGIRFVRDIERPAFDQSKFIVASGMRYITVNDARVPSQQDVMMNMMTGGAMGNSATNIFDPIVYPLVDLMDARVAMDKKDIRNDYTFPTVRVKYVSEVLFKGQSGTTITVSTDDDVLTERLNFTGRASVLRTGERIRIYYTIAKDPLEKWEMQAIERLQ
jgi:hypothetical protein